MLFYIGIFVWLFVLAALEVIGKKNKITNTISIFPLFVLCVLAGARNEVGTDYLNYLHIFNNLEDSSHIEFGFIIISKLLFAVGGVEACFFGISCMAILLKAFFFTKFSRFGLTAIVLYYGSSYINWEMGAIRIGLATAVYLFAIKFLSNGNFIRYSLIVLLASSIHQAMLILWPCYFIVRNIPWNTSMIAFMILITVALSFFKINQYFGSLLVEQISGIQIQLSYKVERYLGLSDGSKLQLTSILKKMTILVIFLYYRRRTQMQFSKYEPILRLYLIGNLIYLFFISSSPALALRAASIFTFFEIFLMTMIVFSERKVAIRVGLFLLFSTVQFGRLISSVSNWPELFFPYSSIIVEPHLILLYLCLCLPFVCASILVEKPFGTQKC